MFWQAKHPKRNDGATHPWRSTLRRAVDLAVAFATLEDVPSSWDHAKEGRTRASTAPGHPDAPGPSDHPHRRPLRSAQRRRRPGTVAARVTPCTTPLAPPVTRRRGRKRAWDASTH